MSEKFRIPTLIGFVVSMLLVSTLPSNGAIWSPDIRPTGPNVVGVNLVDSFFNTGENVSTLTAQGNPRINPDGTPNARLCKAIGTDPCNKADQTYIGNLLLPACKSASDQWCIESLSVQIGRAHV